MPAFSRRYTEASPTKGPKFRGPARYPKFRAIFATSDRKAVVGTALASAATSLLANSKLPPFAVEILMLKFVILGVASLAFVGTAVAADLPRPEPQPAAAPVGKYPLA